MGTESSAAREPAILWPGPGAPALLAAGEREISLLVHHAALGDETLRRWATGLALREVGGATRVALEVVGVGVAAPELAQARAGAALALPELARRACSRVRLRAGSSLAPSPPARVRTFDLVAGDVVLRSRCVAAHAASDGTLRIAFASDLHFAEMWDVLAEAVARHASDLLPAFFDPRRHLARMIAQLNATAARGELDVLVLGGDLVDHVYRVGRSLCSGCADESNVPLLIEALAGLRVPSFAIPGNHDFRLYPWRPRSYGLVEVGIPAARTRGLLQAAGLWGSLPLRPADLDALRSHEPSGRTALAQHLHLLAPETDHRVTFGALELIFLSTGRDMLPRWRSLEPGRRMLLVRALPTTWLHPDLEGLREAQIRSLEADLEHARAAGHGAAVFLHAPLLHPPARGRVEDRIDRLDPGEDASLRGCVGFERQLQRSGLRHGVFFRNPGPFVRALAQARVPVAAFSGHVHHGHTMLFDRESLTLRSAPWGELPCDGTLGALVTAPSLGQTDVTRQERPGYLLARFDAGRLRAVTRQAVAESA